MITGYTAAVEYLYANLPMFQRVGAAAFKKDLGNTLALCRALGNPHQTFRAIHVAGTNGKGSASHMLAAILQQAGYRTGLYTSPHLKSFTERIRINGRPVEEDFVVDFVNRMRVTIDEISPSFFELTVAMAFDYFARRQVDVAVIETGLGGRLDSTNVITPVVSVITNISFDHTDLLGNTLPEIAFEKAGIIKPGVPVVISQRQPEVEDVFKRQATALKSDMVFASARYRSECLGSGRWRVHTAGGAQDYQLDLPGNYQGANLAGVLAVCDVLQQQGFSLANDVIKDALSRAAALTGLKGRWQVLQRRPTIIADTAHNEAGIQSVMQQLQSLDFENLWMVLGVVKDKDLGRVLRLLPPEAKYVFCQAAIPRALPAAVLARQAAAAGLHGVVVDDVNEALAYAIKNATVRDLIFVGGSTFVVAAIDNL
jgi:dihydrofolate synthase/folylpolyglutamate synthase